MESVIRIVANSLNACLSQFRDDKTIRVRTYLDAKEALEAAGLSE